MNNEKYSIFWEETKKELETLLPSEDFTMWINRIGYYSYNSDTKIMSLSVPSNFIKDNVIRFKESIEQILTKLFGTECFVEISVIVPDKIERDPVKLAINHEEKIQSHKTSSEEKISQPQYANLQKNTIKKDKNPDVFSFDSFVISNSNEFAANTAKAIAENPGTKYNPYFIWGASGLGKTHLLRAIEKFVKENYPSKKVLYQTSEEFLNEFTNSITRSTQEQFRIKYRQLDVFLLDDVQFLSNKEQTQIELFNTFNKLHDSNKQMVFSCDQPIQKVKKMEERLASRFAMGLTVDLRPPDFELRMAILKNLSEIYALPFKNDAFEYIATNISGSIRELKGVFNELLAYASFTNKSTITKDIAIDRLKDKITSSLYNTPVSVDKIILTVAKYYNVKSQDIIGEQRTKSIVLARQVSMYLSRKLTRLSTTQIGAHFGDKEHGTIMHATKKIDDLVNRDVKIKSDVDSLMREVQE